jgi:uncharacterized protein (UPF0216 family)
VEGDGWSRIFGFELHRMHQALVAQPVPLAQLASMAEPSATNRDGSKHAFDKTAVTALAQAVGPGLAARLRVPIRFFDPSESAGSCYVEDPAAIEALQRIGAATTSPREGRMWMSSPLARRLALQYPTLVEFVPL